MRLKCDFIGKFYRQLRSAALVAPSPRLKILRQATLKVPRLSRMRPRLAYTARRPQNLSAISKYLAHERILHASAARFALNLAQRALKF